MFTAADNFTKDETRHPLYCVWIRAHEGKRSPLAAVWIDPAMRAFEARPAEQAGQPGLVSVALSGGEGQANALEECEN